MAILPQMQAPPPEPYYDDTCIGDVVESIETNLWLSQAYTAQGADGLAKECVAGARFEFNRFRDLLLTYVPDVAKQLERLLRANTLLEPMPVRAEEMVEIGAGR